MNSPVGAAVNPPVGAAVNPPVRVAGAGVGSRQAR